MPELLRWNDDRLDDLAERVRGVSETVAIVPRLDERVRRMSEDMTSVKSTVEGLDDKLDSATQTQPLQRIRSLGDQLKVTAGGAIIGGAVVFLITRAAGG